MISIITSIDQAFGYRESSLILALEGGIMFEPNRCPITEIISESYLMSVTID
jgi:hypothetical protein